MTLKVFNTASRKKESITLRPDQKKLFLYTCGPTVYHYAHIGNFRTYVFEDLFRRTLEWLGFKVQHVMNITDVEDKTIKGAIEKGESLESYTTFYKEAFFQDMETLGLLSAHAYPLATDHIPDMIQMIERLLKKGLAYEGKGGSIYFSIRHFPHYGKLSHLNLSELKVGASERVAQDEYEKDSAADFVLWKGYDPKRDGEVFWESPFGKGRPGWHIECSAMATKLLGETIDIHMGGVDNIFPHHENEIAQSEGCSGKPFARYWIHVEHLIVEGKKMSKSLGNFFTLRDLIEKGFAGNEIRYLLMSSHYRAQLNFTFEGLSGAKQALQRFTDFIYRLKQVKKDGPMHLPLLKKCKEAFREALEDDLNISLALAAVFDLVRQVNGLIDTKELTTKGAKLVLALLKDLNQVLGIFSFETKEEQVPSLVLEALEKREEARAKKDWDEADKQRAYIQSQGYIIEDGPTGSRVKKHP